MKYRKKELEQYLIQQKPNEPIESYKKMFKYFLGNRNSIVLNFNYTDTIKKLYGKETMEADIFHIHGELENLENPIIFGYAANEAENTLLVNKNYNEYVRNIKKFAYNRTNNKSKLKNYLNKQERIYVHILGHSFRISDSLILEEILNHKNIKSIQIYYHETYENYFNIQVNMYRIMRNNFNFEKVVNFQDSIRMPQAFDSKEQVQSFDLFLKKIMQEYKNDIPPAPSLYFSF